MSITARQAELFAGETWDSIYSAFAQINFNATDPVSINAALQTYLRNNYPEDFNDWIVSSEMVALIDLLSWLAGTLAFKTDLAARENFLDTAESRESILRLARFLSYNPSRCQPATGVVKIVSVSSDDDVFDSFGTNLANSTITWNDPNNPNWQEQLTAVLNGAFVPTNPYGIPLKAGTVANVTAQLYRVNGLASNSSFAFTSNVGGLSMDFEICNGDFSDGGSLFERPPNPNNAFNLYYLNDGNGNSSSRTGYFMLFKQGSTVQQTFNITVPIENQTLDMGSTNVNQNDCWVQTLNDSGQVTIDWIKVPAVINANVTFNNVPASQRSIFSVLTRDNDQITIRFSDGRFGNAPYGNIRVTYRVSNGLSYQIKPLEINNIQQTLYYVNSVGATKTLTLTFSLFETVVNAAVAETVEQIRQRAPQVYATQNRMVSGEDYNVYPLSSNLAAKIKAVNRVYSGQSRYIDLHDPTGTYQDLSLFSEDGILFADPWDTYLEVPASLNKTPDEIVNNYILPAIDQYTTTNLLTDVFMQNVLTNNITAVQNNEWTTSSADLFQTTGWFSQTDDLIQPGAIIQFSISGVPTWVAVADMQGLATAIPAPNTAGPVTLSREVPTGSTVIAILPSASVLPDPDLVTTMISNIEQRLSFSLWYDYAAGPAWVLDDPLNDFGAPTPSLDGTRFLVMNVNYRTSYVGDTTLAGGMWQINSRGLGYVFESINDIEFFDNGSRALAQLTGVADLDTIRVMRINRDLNNQAGHALPNDFTLTIDRLWLYPGGTAEPRRCTVLFFDSNQDGYPDLPDTFYRLISDNPINTFLFWTNAANPPYDLPIYTVRGYDTADLRTADDPPVNTVGFQLTGATDLDDATFWVYQGDSVWQEDVNGTYRFERGRGPNVAASWVTEDATVTPEGDSIIFHWRHFAPSDHRIDPSPTNIVDIFVLTFAYDAQVRQWITQGADPTSTPQPPTELDLRLAFSNLESFKMFSDQIVWRPVKYRYLFGSTADRELQAQFKVVRLPNASISDGEIKSRIITAINTYFAVTNWDFGETFWFTELAAYIHQQLAGLIGSVVLVPQAADSAFGDGFEVSCRSDEIFVSTAQVSDIVLIPSNTALNLRIRN